MSDIANLDLAKARIERANELYEEALSLYFYDIVN